MFCPEGNYSNEIEHASSSIAKSLSLSYTNLNSTEPNALFPDSQEISAEKTLGTETPNGWNCERRRSNSIGLTVTTASSPVNAPELNSIPAVFSLNGFMSASEEEEDPTDLLQRETNLTPERPPVSCYHHADHLRPPPVALPYTCSVCKT